jgi:hypothetical protein
MTPRLVAFIVIPFGKKGISYPYGWVSSSRVSSSRVSSSRVV